MNTITKQRRAELLTAALQITDLDEAGEIAGGLTPTARRLAEQESISLPFARRLVAQAARIQRHPDWQPPATGRPTNPEPLRRVTVTLTEAQIDLAQQSGDGNVSIGLRRILDAS